ncbi:hypothetical protein GE09DRAFT_531551 [Coniochaeta sp. 2T2.1]|nr:hypothetical protein GE09DRAFT_531551 [Coniochaeta sp. 2T2.1]
MNGEKGVVECGRHSFMPESEARDRWTCGEHLFRDLVLEHLQQPFLRSPPRRATGSCSRQPRALPARTIISSEYIREKMSPPPKDDKPDGGADKRKEDASRKATTSRRGNRQKVLREGSSQASNKLTSTHAGASTVSPVSPTPTTTTASTRKDSTAGTTAFTDAGKQTTRVQTAVPATRSLRRRRKGYMANGDSQGLKLSLPRDNATEQETAREEIDRYIGKLVAVPRAPKSNLLPALSSSRQPRPTGRPPA